MTDELVSFLLGVKLHEYTDALPIQVPLTLLEDQFNVFGSPGHTFVIAALACCGIVNRRDARKKDRSPNLVNEFIIMLSLASPSSRLLIEFGEIVDSKKPKPRECRALLERPQKRTQDHPEQVTGRTDQLVPPFCGFTK